MSYRSPVNLVVFSGSTRRPSKSRALAEAMALKLAERRPINVRHFDLIDAGVGLSAWSRGGLDRPAREVVEAVEEAEALIVTAPTYRGSYPGLFKHLFDLVDTPKLEGKPVLIGATGGGHRHALVVEHQIRPLFAFFSAAVAPTAVYASEDEFADGQPADPALLARIDLAVRQFAPLLPQAEEEFRLRAVG
jgi:FMN reductase